MLSALSLTVRRLVGRGSGYRHAALVTVFEQCTRPKINPSTSLWLTRCQETSVLQLSMELLVHMDLSGLSALQHTQRQKQSLYAPHLPTFHIAFASIQSSAERLASERASSSLQQQPDECHQFRPGGRDPLRTSKRAQSRTLGALCDARSGFRYHLLSGLAKTFFRRRSEWLHPALWEPDNACVVIDCVRHPDTLIGRGDGVRGQPVLLNCGTRPRRRSSPHSVRKRCCSCNNSTMPCRIRTTSRASSSISPPRSMHSSKKIAGCNYHSPSQRPRLSIWYPNSSSRSWYTGSTT
jgi:hypothetical protein